MAVDTNAGANITRLPLGPNGTDLERKIKNSL